MAKRKKTHFGWVHAARLFVHLAVLLGRVQSDINEQNLTELPVQLRCSDCKN